MKKYSITILLSFVFASFAFAFSESEMQASQNKTLLSGFDLVAATNEASTIAGDVDFRPYVFAAPSEFTVQGITSLSWEEVWFYDTDKCIHFVFVKDGSGEVTFDYYE